jgi:hypothetical protein
MQLSALSPLSPLGRVLNDIQRALDARLYYPALLTALTVPEICMSLTLDKNVFVKERHYVAFVDKYTTPSGLGFAWSDCYRLRGGVVHRANMAGHPKFDATHVIFSLPESRINLHALSISNGEKLAAMLDLVLFCKTMIEAAKRWYEDHKDDTTVAKNMKNLIRFCPAGMPPFIAGWPVVASGR